MAGVPAAATTSLPERIGGWYASLSWMLSAISGTAPDIRPFYDVRGRAPGGQGRIGLRGYRDSRPVHRGNQAGTQDQWGNYGDLLESVWLAVSRGDVVLDMGTARMLEEMADRVCDLWARPDSGIWELGERRHYTISKMACWVTLDRMVRLAELGQLSVRDTRRWQAEAAAIRDWVDERCWSRAKRSYTFYAGTEDLDASVLLAARTGFLAPDDPRLGQTIDAIRRELADGALVYRYTGARSAEGAFLACSFWLVDAMARSGRADEAREVWKGVVTHASDLGLLSEEIDPASGELRGNLPQALSHLALVTAAYQLGRRDPDD